MGDKFRLIEGLYGILLYLYPKPFRATYGEQMRLTFRDGCRVAYHRDGMGGLVALWFPTLLDLLKSVVEAWMRQGELTMLKERLVGWAGALTILIGALWLVAAMGDLFLRSGFITTEPEADLFLALLSLVFIVSFIPMVFALIATRLRFQDSVGSVGKIGLALSVAGGVGVIISILAAPLLDSSPEGGQVSWLSYVAFGSMLSIRVGYILFGIDVWKYKLLPRWNLLPLLLGLTVVLSLPFVWFGVPAVLPYEFVSPMLHFAISGACWLLLGMAMVDKQREPQRVATI